MLDLIDVVRVDLDGTLAEPYVGGFRWGRIGDPRPGAVAFTHTLRDRGFKIVIETGRGVREARRWLKRHGFAYTTINEPLGVGWVVWVYRAANIIFEVFGRRSRSFKIPGLVLVDDRVVEVGNPWFDIYLDEIECRRQREREASGH